VKRRVISCRAAPAASEVRPGRVLRAERPDQRSAVAAREAVRTPPKTVEAVPP